MEVTSVPIRNRSLIWKLRGHQFNNLHLQHPSVPMNPSATHLKHSGKVCCSLMVCIQPDTDVGFLRSKQSRADKHSKRLLMVSRSKAFAPAFCGVCSEVLKFDFGAWKVIVEWIFWEPINRCLTRTYPEPRCQYDLINWRVKIWVI